MSYSFGLFFKQCESFEEGFHTALDVTALLRKHHVEYIKNNVNSCPSVNFSKPNRMADRYWLYELMQLKFIYFKEYNILSLSGYHYVEDIANTFDCHVCFQNSTDNTYPLETYSDKINLFKELKSELSKDSTNDSNIQEEMYDKVCERLHLREYIWRESNDMLTIFSLNAIDDECISSDMNRALRKAIHDKTEEEIIEFAEMVAPSLTITDEVLATGVIKYHDKDYVFDYNGEEDVTMCIAKQIVRAGFIDNGKIEN